jgi:Helitron helicase-like domain at N-terminus
VQRSDESQYSIHAKIWGTSILFNLPILWITINPADTQDPIAQVFYRKDIDLDHFCNTASPDNTQRSSNITSDPFSSAKFFHFMIQTIVESLFCSLQSPTYSRKSGWIPEFPVRFWKFEVDSSVQAQSDLPCWGHWH